MDVTIRRVFRPDYARIFTANLTFPAFQGKYNTAGGLFGTLRRRVDSNGFI